MHSLTHSSSLFNRLRVFSPAYARGAAGQIFLCELPSLEDAVRHVEHPTLARDGLRPLALRAFVSLFQETKHVVWIELLLAAYAPTLRGFAAEQPDDLDWNAEVLARFCEVIAEVSLRAPSITLAIQTRLRARLEEVRIAEQSWREVLLMPDMNVFAAPGPNPEEVLASRQAIDPRDIDDRTLLETFGDPDALTELVEALFPAHGEKARARILASLSQRRARTARRVRKEKGRRFA